MQLFLWIYAESYLSDHNTHDLAFLFIIDYVASVSSISGCEHWVVENQWGRVRQMPVALIVTKQVKRKKEREMNYEQDFAPDIYSEQREGDRERDKMFMKQLTHILRHKWMWRLKESEMVKYCDITVAFTKNQHLSVSFSHTIFSSSRSLSPPYLDSQRSNWWGWADLWSEVQILNLLIPTDYWHILIKM